MQSRLADWVYKLFVCTKKKLMVGWVKDLGAEEEELELELELYFYLNTVNLSDKIIIIIIIIIIKITIYFNLYKHDLKI